MAAKRQVDPFERPIWDRETLAEYVGVAVATVEGWTRKGYGPPAFRTAPTRGSVRYRRSEVMRWIERQERDGRELVEHAEEVAR